MEKKTKKIVFSKKSPFEFKQNYQQTGLLLALHHTEETEHNEIRVPFRYFQFSKNNRFLVAINSRSDTFVFDCFNNEHWRIDELATNCCCFAFDSTNVNTILIGTKDGTILTVDIETGDISSKFQAINNRLIDIFVIKSINCLSIGLCYSAGEVKIWSQNNESKLVAHRQLLCTDAIQSQLAHLLVKKVSFHSFETKLTVAVLLNDDSVYIYDNIATDCKLWPIKFELAKHIHPIERRNLHVEQNNNNKYQIDDGTILDIKFVDAGAGLLLSSSNSCISVMDASDWQIVESISIGNFVVTAFWPLPSDFIIEISKEPMHKLWIGLTTTHEILVIYQQTENNQILCELLVPPKCQNMKRMTLSKDCNMLTIRLLDGSINVYRLDFLIKELFVNKNLIQSCPDETIPTQWNENTKVLNQKVEKILPRQRLLLILNEYGEYPAKFRPVIWRTMLHLPINTHSYTEILNKGPHPCTYNYDKLFPINNRGLKRNFMKIVSYLAHWSRIVAIQFNDHESFLPYFIFPFVKVYANNLLVCFELIATILLNQCQLWFEFSPMPPLNYFGLIENIISYFEPSLIDFYRQHTVSSVVFAWEMSRTAFSEILNDVQWLQLWDHIVTAPSYFIIFVVAAYNSLHRHVIERLPDAHTIELFFNEPSNIDTKIWIAKAHAMMNECPPALHPNQYMYDFESLNIDGKYRRILNYPKQIVDRQEAYNAQLAQQTKAINRKYMELEKTELDLMKKLTQHLQCDEHERRMRKVDLVHEKALQHEVKRIEDQRKHLILYKRQIHNRKLLKDMALAENQLENIMSNHEYDVKRELNRLNCQKIHDETEFLAAEQNLRKLEIDMFTQECIGIGTSQQNAKNDQFGQKLSDEALKLHNQLKKLRKAEKEKHTLGEVARQSADAMEHVTKPLEEIITEMLNLNKILKD